jgi:poly(A) polymerase Pap1
MPGQPSSRITPAFAFHLLAGILNNNRSTTEMIRLVPEQELLGSDLLTIWQWEHKKKVL